MTRIAFSRVGQSLRLAFAGLVVAGGLWGLWGESSGRAASDSSTAAAPLWTLTENPEPTDFSKPGAGQPKYFTSPVSVEAGKAYTLDFSGQAGGTCGACGTSEQYDALYEFAAAPPPPGAPLPRRCCIDLQVQGHEGHPTMPGESPSQNVPYVGTHDYTVKFVPPYSGALEVRDVMRYAQGSNTLTGKLVVRLYAGGVSPPPPTLTVSIRSFDGEVLVRHPGRSWIRATPGSPLDPGDEIFTGVDSHALLTFENGSTMQLGELTQMLAGTFLRTPNRLDLAVQLKVGEIKAQVKKETTLDTSFKIVTATATAGVRGTVFTVFYDPVAKVTIVRTLVHKVAVTPSRRGAKTIIVPAGREILASRSGVSHLAAIGKAGARGGIDIQKARDLTLAFVDRFASACRLTAPHAGAAVKPAGTAAWIVTIPVGGKVRGTSSWRVAASKVTPINAVAKQIAAGCH